MNKVMDFIIGFLIVMLEIECLALCSLILGFIFGCYWLMQNHITTVLTLALISLFFIFFTNYVFEIVTVSRLWRLHWFLIGRRLWQKRAKMYVAVRRGENSAIN